MFFQNILHLCLTSLWFHLFHILSSFGFTFNIPPKPWKMCFSLSILTHPLASQHSFAVLYPDLALVLPLPQSDNLRTSERWSLTAQSLQQISHLYRKSCKSLFLSMACSRSSKRQNSEILVATLANLHWVHMNYLFFKTSETWSNLDWQETNLLPRPTHFFGLCSPEQAVPRNLGKGNENFCNLLFKSAFLL